MKKKNWPVYLCSATVTVTPVLASFFSFLIYLSFQLLFFFFMDFDSWTLSKVSLTAIKNVASAICQMELLFCEVSKDELRSIRVMFLLVREVRGLHINFVWTIFSVGGEGWGINFMSILASNIGTIPTTLSTLMFLANFNSNWVWDIIQKRIASWKHN